MWDRRGVEAGAWFARIGPNDVQQLVTDVGPVPANIGALLLLDTPADVDTDAVRTILAERLAGVPRLRQRLMDAPWGGGRPVWVDDPDFDAHELIEVIRCPDPGELAALVDVAMAMVTRPLDRRGPLWRAALVTGARDGGLAVTLTLHHVLADGLGGLAVLGALADTSPASASPGREGAPPSPRPRPAPTGVQLRRDAWAARRRAIARLPRSLAAVLPALAELGRSRPGRAPRTSLNRPTGPRRSAGTLEVALRPLGSAAREAGGTVTDALLAAVAGAVGEVLRTRGEDVPGLVVSVPVSARRSTTTGQLGNQVGVMAVRVPTAGPIRARIADVAATTAAHKSQRRGASAALVAPAFRVLAALGAFRWMIDHQRAVNTFLTSMRGPGQALALGGMPIRRIIPLTIATGNVPVAVAALSYADALGVTVVVDPDLVPERDALVSALQRQLRDLVADQPHT
jgi:WS/DGAT/MGAT family acyltransferase